MEYVIINNRTGKVLSNPSKDEDALWDKLTIMEVRGCPDLTVVPYQPDIHKQ